MRRAGIVLAVAAFAIAWTAVASADPGRNAPRVPTGVRVERDLTYRRVGGEDLKLDAYVPVGAGRRPAVVVIYGGGWIVGSKELSGPFAQELADQGFAAFAMNYRLAPQHPFPAAIDDVRASVEWVRAHASEFGVDPSRIGAIGGSAGGHLAALLGTLGEGPVDRGARVAAAVSWAGPMDLHPNQFGPDSQPYLDAFLNCIGRPCDEATVVAASPISHVDRSDPPILLADGEVDELVPPDQVVRMSAALRRAGVPNELLLVPDAGHDERVVPPVKEPSYQFLRRELGGVESASPGSVGTGGGGNYVAPIIAVVIAVLAVGAVVLAGWRRRRVRY